MLAQPQAETGAVRAHSAVFYRDSRHQPPLTTHQKSGMINAFPVPGLMGASMVEPSVARARV